MEFSLFLGWSWGLAFDISRTLKKGVVGVLGLRRCQLVSFWGGRGTVLKGLSKGAIWAV